MPQELNDSKFSISFNNDIINEVIKVDYFEKIQSVIGFNSEDFKELNLAIEQLKNQDLPISEIINRVQFVIDQNFDKYMQHDEKLGSLLYINSVYKNNLETIDNNIGNVADLESAYSVRNAQRLMASITKELGSNEALNGVIINQNAMQDLLNGKDFDESIHLSNLEDYTETITVGTQTLEVKKSNVLGEVKNEQEITNQVNEEMKKVEEAIRENQQQNNLNNEETIRNTSTLKI